MRVCVEGAGGLCMCVCVYLCVCVCVEVAGRGGGLAGQGVWPEQTVRVMLQSVWKHVSTTSVAVGAATSMDLN